MTSKNLWEHFPHKTCDIKKKKKKLKYKYTTTSLMSITCMYHIQWRGKIAVRSYLSFSTIWPTRMCKMYVVLLNTIKMHYVLGKQQTVF